MDPNDRMQNVQPTHDQMYIRVHSLTSPSADPWLSDLRHEYERCRDKSLY